MKTNRYFSSYLAQFFLEWKKFQTKVLEKIETRVLRSIIFFNRAVYQIMWKNIVFYNQAGHNGIMAHAHCMLYT